MNNFINLTALVLGLILSYSALAKSVNTTEKSNNGTVDIFYVGSDASCGYSSIQAAIDAANNSQNATEVRVGRNMGYFENLQIDNSNILIDGTYANCADAQNNIHIDGTTILNDESESGQVTIKITGIFVHIKGITLINNDQGGIFANATSVITLEDMVFNQLGTHALHITGDNQIVVRIKNAQFLNNTGDFGSAISCGSTKNTDHSIEVTAGSSFENNSVTGTGGAVVVTMGCDFTMTDGTFNHNSSNFRGGGIYAGFLSKVNLNRVTFNGNTAGTNGGAIAAGDARIIGDALHFIGNESIEKGGAISIELSSSLTLKNSQEYCTNSIKCSLFNGNKSAMGGALYNQGHINISSTYFENNRADQGTVIHSSRNLDIESSIFTQNGNNAAGGYTDVNVIQVIGEVISDSNTSIIYSTFADNKVLFETFSLKQNADLSLYSSIIYDPNSGDVFDIENGSTVDVNCLITHEDQSFDANNSFVTVIDPIFVDPTNGDYHIDAATSPAVDYCTDALAMAEFTDIDNQVRGYDDPSVTNNPATNGAYDIGADETYDNDIIFENNFAPIVGA